MQVVHLYKQSTKMKEINLYHYEIYFCIKNGINNININKCTLADSQKIANKLSIHYLNRKPNIYKYILL